MSGSEKPVTFDVCRIIQSIARDCIKTTQDSEVNTPLRGVALNEIYATDLASVMNVMDSMTANSLKTASVPMVTSTGLQYASCTDAWAAVKAAFDSPQGASIMRNLGQMNQFVAPQQEDSGQQTDFIGGAATTLFGSAGQAHNITTAAFVLNQIDKGVLQYRKSLGIAADYQLFEASPILVMSHQKCGRRVMRVNSPLVTRHTQQPLQPVEVCHLAGFWILRPG